MVSKAEDFTNTFNLILKLEFTNKHPHKQPNLVSGYTTVPTECVSVFVCVVVEVELVYFGVKR